jgi:predicted ribosomally synthesized peptide with nif11-like leader
MLWLKKTFLMSADSSSIQDSNLEAFIALVLSDNELKTEIKSALNQDQVISIAASRGYEFDSSAILRKWSKHTDFAGDTWMGWFDD